jgi:hypothetical protein
MCARFFATAFVLAALAWAGCSSGPATSATPADCHANPTECPVGDTCWPISATALGCIPNQATAGFGASCTEEINLPTCANGLLCDAMNSDGSGTCASYCNLLAPCPAGYACRQTTVGTGPTVDICRAAAATATPSDDGGGFSSSDGGDSDASIGIGSFDATLGPDSMSSMQ